MYLLDTNVVSELMKLTPSPNVMAWIDQAPSAALFISSVTQAEILYGVELLPESKRRDALFGAAKTMFDSYFLGRVMPFDSDAAESFSVLAAGRKVLGRPIALADAQIAAIAHCRGAILVTRNVLDFDHCGIEIVNPWEI